VISVFVANFVRDFGVLSLGLVLNIVLIVLARNYLKRRRNIVGSNSNDRTGFKKIKDVMIALILCSFSVLIHTAAFMVWNCLFSVCWLDLIVSNFSFKRIFSSFCGPVTETYFSPVSALTRLWSTLNTPWTSFYFITWTGSFARASLIFLKRTSLDALSTGLQPICYWSWSDVDHET